MENEKRDDTNEPQSIDVKTSKPIVNIVSPVSSRVAYLEGYQDGMQTVLMLFIYAALTAVLIWRFYGSSSGN